MNCLFYALSYLITGSISQHYELRKAILSNMPNFEEELFDSTLSKTRYSSIHDYVNKSKMYRNYVWATETEIITLTAILGITIYSKTSQQRASEKRPNSIQRPHLVERTDFAMFYIKP